MTTRYDDVPRTLGAGYLFGIPLGELGWFASLLMGLASGMAAFFAATFCGIFFILIYNTSGHKTGAAAMDFANSYRMIGLPAGALVGVLALGYLGMLWVKRRAGR